jgi:hypothetical protein
MRSLISLCTTAALAVVLAACGATRTTGLVYVKRDSSEQRMLQDEDALKRTKGVTQVIMHIDADNTVTLKLFVDEGDNGPGRQKALELGYSQIRN